MVMNWNEAADHKLFVAVLLTTNVKVDNKAVAEFMGPECSTSAVQHRIQRIKENAKSAGLVAPAIFGKNAATADSATPSSPAPEDGEDMTTPTPAPKKRRGRPRKSDASPTKKAKGLTETAAATVNAAAGETEAETAGVYGPATAA